MRVTLEYTEPITGGPEGRDVPLRAVIEQEGEPTVELGLAGPRGPVTGVIVQRTKGVVSRDLRLPIDRYLDVLAERFGLSVGGRRTVPIPGRRPEQGPVFEVRHKGRRHSDDFLHQVADAYRAAGNSISGLTPERNPEFDASDASKYRWIRAARERGLLEGRQ
jgi:hypothetical protein